jgi:hypothetical protein
MQAEMPFYDIPEKALDACIQSLGGCKKVGRLLFPEKTIESASTYLSNCVDPHRNEKLSLSHTMMLFRLAKGIGFYSPFVWFSNECGYDARPIAKDEEVDRLTTVVEQASKTLSLAVASLERIQRSNIKTG